MLISSVSWAHCRNIIQRQRKTNYQASFNLSYELSYKIIIFIMIVFLLKCIISLSEAGQPSFSLGMYCTPVLLTLCCLEVMAFGTRIIAGSVQKNQHAKSWLCRLWPVWVLGIGRPVTHPDQHFQIVFILSTSLLSVSHPNLIFTQMEVLSQTYD